MLCPHCGAEIADESRACPKCRTSLALDSPALAATDVARGLPQQERQIRRLLIGAVLLAVVGWIAWSAVRRVAERGRVAVQEVRGTSVEMVPVVTSAVTLKPRTPQAFGFAVPPGCASAVLESQFDESAEQGPPAQVTVFDEAAYAAWKSRQASHAAYTGRLRSGTLDVSLPAFQGRYFLVLTSASSALPKALRGQVQLRCTRSSQ